MVKEYHFKGRDLEELRKMSIEEFARLLPSRERRTLKRGLTQQQKKLIEKIRKHPEKFHKTHLRDLIILPEMVGQRFGIYAGGAKGEAIKWISVEIKPEMIGRRLGEFAIPIKKVAHSAPGIGSSKGSKHIAMK